MRESQLKTNMDTGPHAEMSKFKHIALKSAIIIAGFSIAFIVDDLQIGQHEVESSVFYSETDCFCSSGVCRGYWDRRRFPLFYRGLFYWKVNDFSEITWAISEYLQLTRNDPSVSRRMNYGAFALMVYGICVFVFWYVALICFLRTIIKAKQLGVQHIPGGAWEGPEH